MSNIKKIFIVAAVLLLIFVLVLSLTLQKKKTEQTAKIETKIVSEQITSYQKSADQPKLEVVAVAPVDEAQKVPLDAKIGITFNQPDDQNDAEFSIHPSIRYDIAWEGNTMIVTLTENYAPGTLYTYIIKYQSRDLPSKTYSFTTIGRIAPASDTQPEGAAEAENAFQRVNHPDVYLSNNVPYSSGTFSVASEFVTSPEGHFQFTVTSLQSTGKEDFIAWLKTLLLDDDQIAKLDVIYQ